MAFHWRKKDAKGLLAVFRVIKDTLNARDGPLENLWGGRTKHKKNIRERKNEMEKIHARQLILKKYSFYGLKKIRTRNLITEKKFLPLDKFPSPPPIIFLMVRPLL